MKRFLYASDLTMEANFTDITSFNSRTQYLPSGSFILLRPRQRLNIMKDAESGAGRWITGYEWGFKRELFCYDNPINGHSYILVTASNLQEIL